MAEKQNRINPNDKSPAPKLALLEQPKPPSGGNGYLLALSALTVAINKDPRYALELADCVMCFIRWIIKSKERSHE